MKAQLKTLSILLSSCACALAVGPPSGGGAKIAHTSNLIAGNGTGNGIDSGIAAADVAQLTDLDFSNLTGRATRAQIDNTASAVTEAVTTNFAYGSKSYTTASGTMTTIGLTGTPHAYDPPTIINVIVSGGPYDLTIPTCRRLIDTGSTTSLHLENGNHVLSFQYINGELWLSDSGGTPAIDDTAYNATSWDGVTNQAPSKNAVRDKFESLTDPTTLISDTAYNATSWDGDTTHAPSKNAVRDKIESLSSGGATDPGSGNAPTADFFVLTLAYKTGIDLKTAGTTAIFTVPTGKNFVCTGAIARVTSVTSAGAGTETFLIKNGSAQSMTQNAASASGTPDTSTYYSSLAAANAAPFHWAPAGDTVNASVVTSQAGSTAVTGTVTVYGYYVP